MLKDLPDFEIKRSRRRTLSVQITDEAKLVINAPFHLPLFFIKRFLADKNDWIQKHIGKIKQIPVSMKKEYQDGEIFLFQGHEYKLRLGNYPEISLTDCLNFPRALIFRALKELEIWYKNQAMIIIKRRVSYHAAIMKADYQNIFFSDTKSKWGTCTVSNCLQFNWRLIMTPLPVLDYVVIHELVHILEKNHSRKFWSKVALYTPAYKQHRKWLHQNRHRLVI